MPEFDFNSSVEAQNPLHPAILGADTVDWTSGNNSSVADGITKGLPAAVISGLSSIYNTWRDYTGQEAMDVGNLVRSYDESWGDYYQQHQGGVDTVGFVVTSILPGTLGQKALKLAQGGEALGAVGRALSLTSSKKSQYLSEALTELGRTGGTVTSQITRAKLKQLSWSVADNVLTSAAAELAIAGTMNDSPLFDNYSYTDFITSVAFGAGFGGLIGGAFDGFAAHGVLKNAGRKIEEGKRLFDTLDNFKRYGLVKSDEALLFAEKIVDLPDDFFLTTFKYNWEGKQKTIVLDTADAFKTARNRAEKQGFDELSLTFNELAKGNHFAGQAYFDFIRGRISAGRAAGTPNELIKDEIQGYMQNVKKVSSLSDNLDDLGQLSQEGVDAMKKQFFLHVEDGTLTTQTSVTVGDILTPKIQPKVVDDGILIGKRLFKQQIAKPYNPEATTLDATARHIWASQLDRKELLNTSVNFDDFSVLDRIVQLGLHEDPKMLSTIQFADGTAELLLEQMDFPRWVNQQKLETLKRILGDGKTTTPKDLREWAAHLNVTPDWVEKAIGQGFSVTDELLNFSQDLKSWLRPKTVKLTYASDLEQFFAGMGYQKPTWEYFNKKANLLGLAEYLNRKSINGFEITNDPALAHVADTEDSTAFFWGVAQGRVRDNIYLPPYSAGWYTGAFKGVGGITGQEMESVLAHELGHATMYISQVSQSKLAIEKIKDELVRISKEYRADSWTSKDTKFREYLNRPDELLADNMAIWLMRPDLRNGMKAFSDFMTDQGVPLSQFEEFYAQQLMKRISGPVHTADALLSHHQRLQIAKRAQENAFASFAGEDAALFIDSASDLSLKTSQQGAGARALGASNADYGRQADLFVQETGKAVKLLTDKNREKTLQTLLPVINKLRESKEAAAELGILTTALRRDARKYVQDGQRLVDREALKYVRRRLANNVDEAISMLQKQGTPDAPIRGSYDISSPDVAEFIRMSTQINSTRLSKQTVLLNASGISRKFDPLTVYAPPVDTVRYPYFAFVRSKPTLGMNSEITMITAKSEEQLRNLAGRVPDEYDVIFKNDVSNFYKAKGEYDYSMQINEPKVNVALQKRGVLGDFFPETRAENVLEDWVRWHANQEESLVRQAVQVKHRQFFNEVGFQSDAFNAASLSQANKVGGIFKRNVANPFQDYIKTALNISKQGEFPLLDSLNEFIDKLGTRAYEALDKTLGESAKGKDLMDFGSVNELATRYGLGSPYKGIQEYLEANERYPRNIIREGVRQINGLLATVGLRLDFINSLVNIVSTPIMLGTELSSINFLSKNNPELVGALAELRTLQVPGQDVRMPSTLKLIGGAIKNYFGPEKEALIARYRANGDIKDISKLYHEMLDDLTFQPNLGEAEWKTKIKGAVEKGSRLTGNTMSEELTRFISADVMRQLSDPLVAAGKLDLKTQNAFISSFVNRVQGNYVTSQRPVIFQGTAGAAVSLFQTYAFNVLQQLTRHIENRDLKTLMTFAGLQSTLFGFNGLPFFDAINTHLIGSLSTNPQHKDAYNQLPAFNKELGDWLLYGTASAFPLFGDKSPALYTRGDINPRHMSIIPINPLDIPAVSASLKLVSTITDFAKKAGNGADLTQSFLQAVEHHGISRPLAGFAQLLAGQSTTSKGGLVSAASDLETTSWLASAENRLIDFGGVTRVLGAKPMDESIALNQMYRNKAYHTDDIARIEALGQAIKTRLAGNKVPTDQELDEFMRAYATKGGQISTFSSSMQRWMRDANTSVVNQMASKLNNPYSQNLQMIMGGEPLQDYRNSVTESDEP